MIVSPSDRLGCSSGASPRQTACRVTSPGHPWQAPAEGPTDYLVCVARAIDTRAGECFVLASCPLLL